MFEDFSKYNGEGTLLREAQYRMLDMLIEVDKICRKHNIPYWLDGGTLLGAVRHGGFIPWDDDIDIALMRDDYKKLCKILKRELPDNFVFQDEHTEPAYSLKCAKVRDKYSYIDEGLPKNTLKEEGLFVDIFSLEKGTLKMKKNIDVKYRTAFRKLRRNYGNGFDHFKSYFSYPIYSVVVFFMRFYARIAKLDTIVYAFGCFVPSNPNQFAKNYFFPIKEMEFENHNFFVPANPEVYLKVLYGDYMKIPPKEKRQKHSAKIEVYKSL